MHTNTFKYTGHDRYGCTLGAVLAAQKKDLSVYTDASVQAYRAAITAAKAKLALEDDAAQADVNKALADLKDAENNLEAKPADKPDKGNLTTAVDAAAKTDLNGYTKESVDAFKKALDAAQKVLKDENATKEQIENVLAKLDAAKKALKKDTTRIRKNRHRHRKQKYRLLELQLL